MAAFLPSPASDDDSSDNVRVTRNGRPIEHTLLSISIADLKEWGLLEVGEQNRAGGDLIATADLTGRNSQCVLELADLRSVIELESRPLNTGLVWYFLDPSCEKLVTRLYFDDGQWAGRQQLGALYASQFETPVARRARRMGNLLGKIAGEPACDLGPARGESRKKKLAELKKLLKEVEKAVRANPQLLEEHYSLPHVIPSAQKLFRDLRLSERRLKELRKKP